MVLIATQSKQLIYAGNAQLFELIGVQSTDGTNVTFWASGASIQMTLYDDEGNPQTGCIQVQFTYVLGSNGNFVASYGDVNFQPAIGTGYTLVVDGTYLGTTIHIEYGAEVQARTF